MGYYSTFSGAITFDPPVRGEELENAPSPPEGLFVLKVDTQEEPHPEGTLIKKFSERIEPRWVDQVKAYSVASDLEAVVKLLPGRTFKGEFRIEGEEVGDVRRVFIDDGKVVEWKAELIWPDGAREANTHG